MFTHVNIELPTFNAELAHVLKLKLLKVILQDNIRQKLVSLAAKLSQLKLGYFLASSELTCDLKVPTSGQNSS